MYRQNICLHSLLSIRVSEMSICVWPRWIIAALFLSALAQSTAMGNQVFRATLVPTVPTPENSWFSAVGDFLRNENGLLTYSIRFGLEEVIPARGIVIGDAQEQFAFDLGIPTIVHHSPGPWPNGYDGATYFSGSFTLPSELEDDLRAGSASLRLEASAFGDFEGDIIEVPEPSSLLLGLVVVSVMMLGRKRIRF
jgi:hypothetical protein